MFKRHEMYQGHPKLMSQINTLKLENDPNGWSYQRGIVFK
jgi:hypothetical protein